MIRPWTEVSLEFFKELFNHYWEHLGNSENKVIEIQNFSGIYYDDVPCIRIFLGAKINPLDYRDWNPGICSVYDSFCNLPEVTEDNYVKRSFEVLNICFFSTGPLITPFGAGEKNKESFFNIAFGSIEDLENNTKIPPPSDRLVMWYQKDKNGNIIYDMSREETSLSDSKRYVRIRIIDFPDWKDAIDSAIQHAKFPDYFSKDDIKKENFKAIEYKEA